MALHPGESGSRRLRQGVERLAVPVGVQRGTIIVGQALRLPSRAFQIHISAWQAMRLPYKLFISPANYFELAPASFQMRRDGPFAPKIGSLSGNGNAAMLR